MEDFKEKIITFCSLDVFFLINHNSYNSRFHKYNNNNDDEKDGDNSNNNNNDNENDEKESK